MAGPAEADLAPASASMPVPEFQSQSVSTSPVQYEEHNTSFEASTVSAVDAEDCGLLQFSSSLPPSVPSQHEKSIEMQATRPKTAVQSMKKKRPATVTHADVLNEQYSALKLEQVNLQLKRKKLELEIKLLEKTLRDSDM